MTALTPEPPEVTGKCYRCGASILWTVTAKGHRMPVDVPPETPTGDETTVLFYEPGALRSRSWGGEAIEDDERLAVPHAATCRHKTKSLAQARRDALARLGTLGPRS